jgi:hypothetical protein
MKAYIFTCDKYVDLTTPCVELFKEYVDESIEPVVVAGSEKPKKEICEIHVTGCGMDIPWGTYAKKFLQSIKDEIFILMLDDYLIHRSFDMYLYNKALKEMNDSPKVMQIMFNRSEGNRWDNYSKAPKGMLWFKYKLSAPYRINTCFGLIRRSFMLKYMKNNYSAWDYEIKGSRQANNPNEVLLGCRQYVCNYVNAVWKGKILTDQFILFDDAHRDLYLQKTKEALPNFKVVGDLK